MFSSRFPVCFGRCSSSLPRSAHWWRWVRNSAATTANAMEVARCPTPWRRAGGARAALDTVSREDLAASAAGLPPDASAAATSVTVHGARPLQTSWMEMVSNAITWRLLLEAWISPSSRQHHRWKIIQTVLLRGAEDEMIKKSVMYIFIVRNLINHPWIEINLAKRHTISDGLTEIDQEFATLCFVVSKIVCWPRAQLQLNKKLQSPEHGTCTNNNGSSDPVKFTTFWGWC